MSGLYVHIPFCASKCRYCDFPSYAGMQQEIPGYLAALNAEMRALCRMDWGVFDTVFIGGGTPSLLTGEQIASLMRMLREHFSFAPDVEITLEANPGTLSEHQLRACREAGVNRLSLGVQTLDAQLLKRIGRIHTPQQAEQAVSMARGAGFSNINLDCMGGLPGQSQQQYLCTLRRMLALAPEHISAYGLILEEGTPLYDDVRCGREQQPDMDAACDMLDAGMQLLTKNGYERYEISNFARPGYACRHNLNYWRNGAYLGLGAAAHSAWRLKEGGQAVWTRWSNPPTPQAYRTAACLPLHQRELLRIPPAEEAFETIMLGLRMVRGIALPAFCARFGRAPQQMYPRAVAQLTQRGWLRITDTHMHLTPQGLDMQNAALQCFLEETE